MCSKFYVKVSVERKLYSKKKQNSFSNEVNQYCMQNHWEHYMRKVKGAFQFMFDVHQDTLYGKHGRVHNIDIVILIFVHF